jgi:hypothetical protein
MGDVPGMWHPDYEGGGLIIVNTGDIQFVDHANFVIMEVAEAEGGKYLGKIASLMFRSVDDQGDDNKVSITLGLAEESLIELLNAIGGSMQDLADAHLIPPMPGHNHGN